jgi:hypothetical protein
MENETEDTVIEPNVASGFGEPSLDADPIDDDLDATLEQMLDEAEGLDKPQEPVEDSTEETIEEPAEESTEEPVEEPVEEESTEETGESEEVELDPEIAAIEKPRNLSEKNQSNWRKLQETASNYKKQAEEAAILRQKLQEVEQNVKVPEDYDDLRRFRAIFDIKNDPDFRSKFEQPISSAKENIYNILKANGASEDVIKAIEQAGGPDQIAENWWKSNAIDKLPFKEAEKLKKNLLDVYDLKEKEQQEIEFASQNAEQYFVEKQKANEEWYHGTVNEIDTYMDEITKEFPWARFQEPPQNATPEQLKAVEQHNSAVSSLAEKFNSALWPTSPQERANIAASAVFSHVLTEQLRVEQQAKVKMSEQLKKLTEENNRLKSAGRLPRQNVSTSNKVSNSLSDRLKMSSSEAIDFGLDEALG